MQSVCKVSPRPEEFLGPFFLVQLVFWLHALTGPASTAAQDSPGLLGVRGDS